MKTVIKIIFLSLLAAVFCLTSCSKKSTSKLSFWMEDNGKIKVLSTISQVGDLASAVGGDRVDSWVLIPKDLDPHSYELVKGDGEKLSRANLIFYNGLGLEHGAALSSFLKLSPAAVSIGKAIQTAASDQIIEKGGGVDPHVWMDVSLWKKAVPAIAAHLEAIDPEGALYYRQRAADLEREMDLLHVYVQGKVREVPSEKRFLATSHDAFSYFSRAYLALPGDPRWEERFEAPEGLAPDGQLNPADIRRTIDFLKLHRVGVVFPESNVSQDAIVKVASASREMGLSVRIAAAPLYGDSTSGLSYFEMMRQNADVLAGELGQ